MKQSSQGDENVDHGDGNDDQGKRPAVADHDNERSQRRDETGDELGKGVADELAERIRIIGVMAHHISVGMGIKIGDGKALHMVKHVISDVLQAALGDRHHETVVQDRADYADQVNAAHAENGVPQAGIIRIAGCQKGRDIIVDDHLGEHRTQNAGGGGKNDRDADNREHPSGIADDVGEQTPQCAASFICFIHLLSLPAAEMCKCPGKFHCVPANKHDFRCRRCVRPSEQW